MLARSSRAPLVLVLLFACASGRATETATVAAAGGEATSTIGALSPISVTNIFLDDPSTEVLPLACEPEAEELCNGVDDDCDAGIDEDCEGLSSGRLQITAFWEPGVDIDLYVVDPRGQTLSFQRPFAVGGALLERASRGMCEGRPEGTPSIESVLWPEGTLPPSGTYEVYVHYWGECLSQAGLVDVTVSISAERPVGSWRVRVGVSERQRVLTFEVQ